MGYIFKLVALAITTWLAVRYGGWFWVFFMIVFILGYGGD